jgi:hypothetical protein
MSKIITLPFAVFALAGCTWAASPLGSASSTQPLDLNGSAVAADVIVTYSAPRLTDVSFG